MKNLAVLVASIAAATAASAQSNVTLFGVVDAQVRYVKNGNAHMWQLASSGYNSSRLGVRGVEDLGGGVNASFWLEHGFNADSGIVSDTTRFWNRRSTVSLSGNFGEIRLGRDFTPSYLAYGEFDPFGDNGIGASGKFFNLLGTTADTNTRSDNEITYLTPESLGGFYGRFAVAAGEGVSGRRYVGGRVGWRNSRFDATVAYGQTRVTPLTPNQDEYKTFHAAASYDFGVAKLSSWFVEKKYASTKILVANIGVNAPIGPVILRAGYTKADARGNLPGAATIAFDDANQIAVGAVYLLSKRTALYGTASRVDNKQRAAYVLATPPALPSPNTGKDSTGFEVGLRHSF